MRKKRNFFGMNFNVVLLGIASLINDLSSEMITPILPFFIKYLGGSEIIVGIIGGLRDSIANILKVLSGYLSDKTGKIKIFVQTGYFTSAVFKTLTAMSLTWPQLMLFSSLERTGKGMRDAPRDALLARYAKKRGKVFGFHKTLDTSGAILGSILVFLLFWIFKFEYRKIITIAAIIAFTSLIPLYFVKEKKVNNEKKLPKIGFSKFSKSLKLFLVISGLFSFSNFSYMFLILKTQQAFPEKLSSTAIPIFLYILYNIFYALFAIPVGIFYDKIGRKRIINLGYFLFSLICLGFIFAKTLPMFIFLFILYGMAYASIETNQRTYVADLSSKTTRGTALGMFYTLTGFLTLLSSIVAGILWQKINSTAPFIFGFITSSLAVILFFACAKKFKKYETMSSEESV
ncbi:MFS transporter [Candidatus Dependentiae bacterium]|nr:MFS transporter [Candidatus Dependentiae bacterium]